MFIKDAGGGYRRTEQIAWGWFLILFQQDWHPGREPQPLDLRACVRYAHMAQCGQFMMGTVSIGAHRVTLSGAYGSDGLPKTMLDPGLWPLLHPLPKDLQDAFWKGGGHNGPGSEAPAIRAWALDHFEQLHAAGSKRYLTLTRRLTNGKATRHRQGGGPDQESSGTEKRPDVPADRPPGEHQQPAKRDPD